MEKSFKETVKQMKPSEIIMAMINGLKKQHVKINMSTFGSVDDEGFCVGCAATNAICEITGKIPKPSDFEYGTEKRLRFFSPDNYSFLGDFEEAIDALRRGYVGTYNAFAARNGMDKIKKPDGFETSDDDFDRVPNLVPLTNYFNDGDFDGYILLAKHNEHLNN